jgi:hypothetical protein
MSQGGASRGVVSGRDGAGSGSVFWRKSLKSHLPGANFSFWRSSRAPEARHLGKIRYVACQGELPTVMLDEVEYVRFTFWPDEIRDGGPARDLYSGSYGWLAVTEDLSEVDRQAELRWFAGAYKGELDRLARHFGAAPRIHWGVLAWMQ